MRILLCIGVLLFAIGFYFPANAPPLWQNNFGTELAVVSDCDDCSQAIAFPFPFPFNGNPYDNAAVTTNGCIHLNGLGSEGTGDYDNWENMEEFLSDDGQPLICPFETDLDTGDGGTIYYNDSGNPLIITWDGVSSHNNTPGLLTTFQLLLYGDGRIVFNYNGMMVGGDFITDLPEGIVAGITPSDLPFDGEPFVPGDPGPVNLNQGPFTFGPTVYERWCYDVANSCGTDGNDTGLPGPINSAFDLDFWSICFEPIEDGFSVTSGFEGNTNFSCGEAAQIPTLSEWGLIAMAGILGIVGFMVMRRRKATA